MKKTVYGKVCLTAYRWFYDEEERGVRSDPSYAFKGEKEKTHEGLNLNNCKNENRGLFLVGSEVFKGTRVIRLEPVYVMAMSVA